MGWASGSCGTRSASVLLSFVLSTTAALADDAPRPEPTSEPSEAAGSAIVAPTAIETPVEYPEGAEGSHVIILELLVLADGSVGDVRVVSEQGRWGKEAAQAARSWTFAPAKRDGKPVPAWIRFEVRFDPPEPEAKEPSVEDAEERVSPSTSESQEVQSEPLEVEVVVHGDRLVEPESARSLSRASVRQLPGAFGDAFRAVETLPGVTPIVSGLPYFYIRGAPPGNIGYFLDGIRVPLLYHVALGPSVIHPAFIERVDLYAGPYPARYGRYSGGIVAGETAPPAFDHRGELSIRLIDSGGMFETRALDGQLSIMAAGRYSYTALVLSLAAPNTSLSYWDYQGRVRYDINDKESLTLFSFGALDKAFDRPPDGPKVTIFDLTFHRHDLRYDRRFDDGGKMRVAATYGWEVSGLESFSLKDRLIGGRVELENPLAENVTLRSGVDLQTDRYTTRFDEEIIDEEERGGEEVTSDDIFPPRVDVMTGARADLVWEATRGVRVIPGLRYDFYVADGTPLWAVSPRLYAEFDVRRDFTIKHGLGVAHQLPSFVVPLPGIQPVGELGLQRSIQHSAGVEWRLPRDWVAEATVFQNIQLNLTDTLSALRFEEAGDGLDTRGIGSGRGFEFLIRRPLTKRLGGYLAYTFSRSTRSFGRRTGPATFDRTHVLSSALGYQLGKGWNAGIRGNFYTGIPAQTIGPQHSFQSPPRTTPFYRFDWRVEKRWTVGAKGAWWALVFEVLNTTLKKEEIGLSCGQGPCEREKIGPITIPSIGAEASF